MKYQKYFSILTAAMAIAATVPPAMAQQTDSVAVAESANVLGADFQQAIAKWTSIIDEMRGDGKFSSESMGTQRDKVLGLSLAKLLLRRGEAYKRIGFYNKASADMKESLSISQALDVPALESMILGSLGDLFLAAEHNQSFIGKIDAPQELFENSLELALDTGMAELISAAGVRLGSWHMRNGEFQIAFGTLQDAVLQSESTDSLLLQANARVKYARAARFAGYEDDAIEIIRNALARIDTMPAGYARAELLLAAGREAAIIGGATANNLGVPAFEKVVSMAGDLVNNRLVGAAFGHLGEWQLQAGDEARAVEMFERAVGFASGAHDLAIDWEWQLARIYRDKQDNDSAIAAYRRSIGHINSIRQDIPVSYVDGRSSFQQTRAPIYLELADLLMRRSDVITDTIDQQKLLFEAQAVMEEVKGSELRDYFRDTCVINQSSIIGDDASADAAVIYPVILADRLALLLKLEGTFYHFSTDVTVGELETEVNRYAELLREPSRSEVHKVHSKRIYDWVIAPMIEKLADQEVETLFFVPDGVLRTVPLAALWTGEKYLVEEYKIATAPGLTLLNSDPLANKKRRTLVAGLSLPGEVIGKLPDDYYVDAYVQSLPDNVTLPTRGSAAELRSSDNDEKVRELHRLPAVALEVEVPAASKLPSTVLLDDQFEYETFADEIQNSTYQIVHVASHGFFGGTVEDSWIMTHDDLIDLGELSALFKPKEFSDYPVELLVLSACETAAGNDLAPLGLSGVALTSGARSVLGSLWVVADDATQKLMQGFYSGLAQSGATKASALQSAQIDVLNNEELKHPFFWAPFILVGNWR